jgi:hypothetical protein
MARAVNEVPYSPNAFRSFLLNSVHWIVVQLGKLLALFGWRPFSSFNVESMKKEASSLSGGLTDFGDEGMTPLLEECLRSLREDKDLNLFGRYFMHEHWVNNVLLQRLKLQRDYKQFPEIMDVPVRKPLFVIGNPRTGSTFLHFLLSCDPYAYAPPMWQSSFPSPPPSHDPNVSDSRIDDLRKEMHIYFDLAPIIRTMHPVDIHLPHECYHFFDRTYLDSQWSVRHQGDTGFFEFYESLSSDDVIKHYEDYRKQMQLLALHHPGFKGENPIHFVMKDPNPIHDYFPEALVKTFPDCNIIEMHRNPADSLHSYFLLESSVAKLLLYGENYDLQKYGQRMVKTFHTRRFRIDRFKESFLKTDADRFMDLRYNDFMVDPVETVKAIYKQFGYRYTPEFESNMRHFIENNDKFKYGNYTSLCQFEPFGYTRESVEQEFQNYIRKYDLDAKTRAKSKDDKENSVRQRYS